jgi:hypothetical protein
MAIEKHIEEFIAALKGGRGDLDSWLECNKEAECRSAIFGVILAEHEACKEKIISKLLEIGVLGDGEYIEAIRAL